MSKPKKFTKLPVEVDAFQNTEESLSELINWIHDGGGKTDYVCRSMLDGVTTICIPEQGHDLFIETMEGRFQVHPNAWVIQGVKGEFYPCDDEIFRLTYSGAFDEDPAV